jgi:hypothetical protein
VFHVTPESRESSIFIGPEKLAEVQVMFWGVLSRYKISPPLGEVTIMFCPMLKSAALAPETPGLLMLVILTLALVVTGPDTVQA